MLYYLTSYKKLFVLVYFEFNFPEYFSCSREPNRRINNYCGVVVSKYSGPDFKIKRIFRLFRPYFDKLKGFCRIVTNLVFGDKEAGNWY